MERRKSSEQRRHQRISATFVTEVFERNRLSGRFMSRNVSAGGMFLETGSTFLAHGDDIELNVMVFGDRYPMRGRVVHHGPGGVGIKMSRVDAHYYRALMSMVG
ncbi:MAG: PilZ domain-containing protein [Gammaproteobacteria bacterium]|nr:PilZ domain-containing protein [Gammaproteobacteria bacterium]